MRLKGAVKFLFALSSNDREGGVRGRAAAAVKKTAQKWTTIYNAYRTSISSENGWEGDEKAERAFALAIKSVALMVAHIFA